MPHPTAPRILAVVGPTASGKSALAIDLAQRTGGEILNADAMQLYRGMDIGTAKTPVAERAGVPHHLLDVLDPVQDASVAAFQEQAHATIDDVLARGRLPILVGGSGLYLRATLDALDFPDTDPAVRAALEARGEHEGPGVLHAELTRLDPEAAERIGSRNTRRLVRALEVIALTGQPYTAHLPQHVYARPALQLALEVPRPALVDRITVRAERMFADGLVAETEAVARGGLGVTASRAVGYAQARAVLAGEMTTAQAAEATAVATRQVARRQVSWFRRDPRITWLDGEASADAQLAAATAVLREAGLSLEG
ncbi:tRNA (adenosine(37)-N6)-dimethylallyltransferase MiaA [Litorihabitans aurantiacus]|uniref:tRNA dimethylallyltransferase n=1 Tax=Litorihabitans aurantiacus TaxID=1930061 RepID=A0AA38CP70_9MICO|nr:tRNA (adenosine(37)-N6)-dimethylallyltransferase MiaA [Litorihabitans aurantiacus]GMA31748.1 tRNA dimethylallyltransferase [Litorihabitans aurantiacus]